MLRFLWKEADERCDAGLEIRRQEQRRRGSSRRRVRILVWGIRMRGVGVGILRLALITMFGCWREVEDGNFSRMWREEECADFG